MALMWQMFIRSRKEQTPPHLHITQHITTNHLEHHCKAQVFCCRMRLEQNVVDHTDGVESLTTERSFVKRAPDQHLGGVPCQVHAIIEKGKNSQMFQVNPPSPLPPTTIRAHTVVSPIRGHPIRELVL